MILTDIHGFDVSSLIGTTTDGRRVADSRSASARVARVGAANASSPNSPPLPPATRRPAGPLRACYVPAVTGDLLPLSRCLGQPMPLRTAVALADALAAAVLAWPEGRHGALCPEVVSVGSDGVVVLAPPGEVPADYQPPPGGNTDAWSVGVLFYEAVTGQRIGHLPEREILHDAAVERAFAPLGLPAALASTVRDLLRFRPAARLSLRHARDTFGSIGPTLPGPPLASYVTDLLLVARAAQTPASLPPASLPPPSLPPAGSAPASLPPPAREWSPSPDRMQALLADARPLPREMTRKTTADAGASMLLLGLGALLLVGIVAGAASAAVWWLVR